MEIENYYEILEVSTKASKEIIEKAYKTLAKKYHPDANSKDKKEWAEEKFKKINEAYEILSNNEKREEYDKKMESERNRLLSEYENLKSKNQKLYEQNQILKNELNNLNPTQANSTYNYNNTVVTKNKIIQEEINQSVNQAINQAYHDAYIQRMKSYGYRIYHKKTFKERVRDLFSIILTIIIILSIMFILWQIPVVRNHIESNKIFKTFIDSFW